MEQTTEAAELVAYQAEGDLEGAIRCSNKRSRCSALDADGEKHPLSESAGHMNEKEGSCTWRHLLKHVPERGAQPHPAFNRLLPFTRPCQVPAFLTAANVWFGCLVTGALAELVRRAAAIAIAMRGGPSHVARRLRRVSSSQMGCWCSRWRLWRRPPPPRR